MAAMDEHNEVLEGRRCPMSSSNSSFVLVRRTDDGDACRSTAEMIAVTIGRHHVPNERLLARSSDLLDAQSRTLHIDRARDSITRKLSHPDPV
jgi:hypothetical protein